MSYVFQSTLIDTMGQYAMTAAEEYLSAVGEYDEAIQRDFPQAETDAELANDTVGAWPLEDMEFKALKEAFAKLRQRLMM